MDITTPSTSSRTRSHDGVRALLAPFLQALTYSHTHVDLLHGKCAQGTPGDFVPRHTWLCLNFDENANAAERRRMRALPEVVGRLCAHPSFSWRDCYASLWRSWLMDPLACHLCRQSISRKLDATEYDAHAQLVASEAPKFVLDLTNTRDVPQKFATLREFLFADPEEALGEALAAELKQVMSASEAGTSSAPCRRMARIELGLIVSSHSVTTAQLRELASILEQFAEQEQRKTADSGVVQFEITNLSLLPHKALSPVDMEILGDIITAEAAKINRIMFGYSAISLKLEDVVEAFRRFLRRTICCDSSDKDERSCQLRTLDIDNAPMAYGFLVALCSALRHRNSLRELLVEWENDMTNIEQHKTDLMWAWIAYGIFHPDAQAKLDNLFLSGWPIRPKDMAAFESVLRTAHPGRLLWILEHGDLPQGKGLDEIVMPPGQRVMVQVKPKTNVRELPKLRSPSLYRSAGRDTEEFEVAIMLESCVSVIVPGYGLGWVSTTSIVSRREVPSKCAVPPLVGDEDPKSRSRAIAAANVKVLSRYSLGGGPADEGGFGMPDEDDPPFAPDSIEDVKFLLQMVGHGLEGFEYPLHHIDISEADLNEMLDSCPNLRQLILKGNNITGIAPLVDRYRARQCQIASLSIDSTSDSTSENTSIAQQLAELLASPSSKPLLSVEVSGLVDDHDRLEQLGKALHANKTLELLSIYLDHPDNGGEILTRIQNEQESVIGSKLLEPTKLAFLSVIHEHASRVPGDPRFASLAKMDSSIVAQVFAFAAVPITRSVIW